MDWIILRTSHSSWAHRFATALAGFALSLLRSLSQRRSSLARASIHDPSFAAKGLWIALMNAFCCGAAVFVASDAFESGYPIWGFALLALSIVTGVGAAFIGWVLAYALGDR